MIKLSIDGKEVTVEKGTTILDAAEKVGINIPTLCHDKRLIGFGACRLCVVQLKGRSRLIPACFNPVRDGMEVLTNTEAIIDARRMQLQLILAEHPLDCPVCDKAGECRLQELVYEYEVVDNPYRIEVQRKPIERMSPFIERDMNRCILCGCCVRICNEVQGVGEISFINRGIRTYIGTDFDRPMNCEFCGQCISVCPVGALNSKLFKYKVRVWDLKTVYTLCPYCSYGCSLGLSVKDNEVKRVVSDYNIGINEGNLCSKGRFGYEYINHHERLKKPLVKKDGRFEEVTWDKALEVVAERLKEIRDTLGGEAIGGLGSARLSNEEIYLFQKLIRDGLKSNNIDHGARYSYQGAMALKDTLGYPATTNTIRELRKTNAILLIRADLSETHPNVKIEVNLAVNKNKAKLIIVDNKRIKLARYAQANLICKPGTEVAVINSIINLVIKHDLADKKFVNAHTEGLDSLKACVEKYTPEYVERICGVSPQMLDNAAKMYGSADKACIVIATGMGLCGNDKEIVYAASNLALITGNIGKESAGVYILGEKNNSQGALDMGAIPEYLPGYVPVDKPGYDALSMLEAKDIKAMYIVGENPVITYPLHNIEELLNRLEFLVVQDMFMTPTAKLADVVLPVCSLPEKSGTYTNIDRRIQKADMVLSRMYETRSDAEIFVALGKLIGYDMPNDVWADIQNNVKIYQEIDEYWGGKIFYTDEEWRGKFVPVEYNEIGDEEGKGEFMITSSATHFYSGSFGIWNTHLVEVAGGACVELNYDDAQRLDINTGDKVKVSSKYAEVELIAKVTHDVPRKVAIVVTSPEINTAVLFGKDMIPVKGSIVRVS